MRRILLLAVCGLALTFPTAATRAADDDAWPLYRRAGEHVAEGDRLGKSSPSSTNMQYPGYPPFSAEWLKVASAAYAYNASPLADIRRATAMPSAAWPAGQVDGRPDYAYLSTLRNLANQVGDAALLEHVRGDDASAFARVGDVLHLADLLDAEGSGQGGGPPGGERADAKAVPAMQQLVAVGLRALALERLLVINSDAHLTDRTAAADVEALARRLFVREPDVIALPERLVAAIRTEDPTKVATDKNLELARVNVQRGVTDRNLAAMALACRLYRFRNGRWPASLDELSALLPAKPTDVAGPMGYALIKGRLPDGGDRPLVYSFAGVPKGDRPAYPTAEPQFGYYVNNNQTPGKSRTTPGQFRDVTLWPGKPDVEGRLGLKPLDRGPEGRS